MNPCQVRYTPAPLLDNGGWHFSYQGGVDRIIEKIEAWTHQEFNTPEIKDPEHIKKCMKEPSDLLGRPEIKLKFIKLDVPKYITDNMEKFKTWIK
jgi:beta-1,4-mannosyl-glycoprotein beta-1,4-N-acetylglucosaminyltransferase